ncbi:MAG: DUF2244 domain-containing protein [Pseudomonadota bacterium]|nr:DUF2244 domain-containing protein [Pseudomonadota bacterium]
MRSIVETWPAEAATVERHDGPVFMDAELAPNRSLRNPAFLALMVAIGLISFTAGMLFITIGAWPVMPFFGLDAILVWVAFRISYRDGKAREWVRVDARDIEVIRRHPTGHMRRFRLPTAWVKLDLINPKEHHSQVALRAHGKALVLASFLSPEERGDFADALAQAITRARNAGPAQDPGGAVH